jgi:hypothetical protein
MTLVGLSIDRLYPMRAFLLLRHPLRDGRPYWKELSSGELPGLRAFQQDHNNPGNWNSVTEAMKNYLKESILDHL